MAEVPSWLSIGKVSGYGTSDARPPRSCATILTDQPPLGVVQAQYYDISFGTMKRVRQQRLLNFSGINK